MHNMEKIHLYDKILSPIVTEKSTNLSEQNKIVFKVPDLNHFSSYDIIKFKKVVFTESSVKELEKRYS